MITELTTRLEILEDKVGLFAVSEEKERRRWEIEEQYQEGLFNLMNYSVEDMKNSW